MADSDKPVGFGGGLILMDITASKSSVRSGGEVTSGTRELLAGGRFSPVVAMLVESVCSVWLNLASIMSAVLEPAGSGEVLTFVPTITSRGAAVSVGGPTWVAVTTSSGQAYLVGGLNVASATWDMEVLSANTAVSEELEVSGERLSTSLHDALLLSTVVSSSIGTAPLGLPIECSISTTPVPPSLLRTDCSSVSVSCQSVEAGRGWPFSPRSSALGSSKAPPEVSICKGSHFWVCTAGTVADIASLTLCVLHVPLPTLHH